MSPLHLTAVSAGLVARRVLDTAQDSAVLGLTSRGLFLTLSNSWVIFLTSNTHRGPLTVNLPDWPTPLWGLQPGTRVEIQDGAMIFSAHGLVIETASSPIWQSITPLQPPLGQLERRDKLADLIELRIQNGDYPNGLFHLLLANDPALQRHMDESIVLGYAQFRASLVTNQSPTIASKLVPFLGLGSGLTPSGDDLAAGFLLALNRWGRELSPSLNPEEINAVLHSEAFLRTTHLSTSLIACACQGQADERLVLALDGIVAGTSPVKDCLAALSDYGSTSGFDALAGMAALI